MDIPTFSSTELLAPLLRQAPPWLILSALAGLACAAAFYILVGRGLRSLPTYVLLGMIVAPLTQLMSAGFPESPPPFIIGEVDLGVAAVGTWALLGVARLLRV